MEEPIIDVSKLTLEEYESLKKLFKKQAMIFTVADGLVYDRSIVQLFDALFGSDFVNKNLIKQK